MESSRTENRNLLQISSPITFGDPQPSLPFFTHGCLTDKNGLDNEIVLCIVF